MLTAQNLKSKGHIVEGLSSCVPGAPEPPSPSVEPAIVPSKALVCCPRDSPCIYVWIHELATTFKNTLCQDFLYILDKLISMSAALD